MFLRWSRTCLLYHAGIAQKLRSLTVAIDNGAYPLRSIIYAVVVLSYDGIFVSRACLNAMLYCGYAYRLLYYILSLSCVLAESRTLHLLPLLLYSNGDALLFW